RSGAPLVQSLCPACPSILRYGLRKRCHPPDPALRADEDIAPHGPALSRATHSADRRFRRVPGRAAPREPAAKIVIDPPRADSLARGRVVIECRAEKLRTVPVSARQPLIGRRASATSM